MSTNPVPCSISITELEDRLKRVLDRYYRVHGNTFSDTDPIQVCKHQVLHLAKLIKKFALYAIEHKSVDREVVVNEVVPDLLIYAQELMFKFKLLSWPELCINDFNATKPVLSLLNGVQKFSSISETFIEVSKATAAIADICDQHDHQQKSSFHIESDVVVPFLKAVATLQVEFDLDVDTIYSKRLIFMREKYERSLFFNLV